MPLMTQIRNNLTKLFAAFAVLFIAYIMLDWGMDLTSIRPGAMRDVVGVVNGTEIKYRDFSEVYRRAVESQRSQFSGEIDDETDQQIREQVWNMMVNQILIDQEINRLGISVSDQEIIEMVHGPNPPEMLVSQFRDSTGKFNRAAYDQAIASPENRQAWVAVEQQLRQQRKQEKLQSLLLATVRVTPVELRSRFIDRTTSLDVQYALFDPNRTVPDTAVSVNDDDLERYYQTHQEEFKVKPARALSYVTFSQNPSKEDTADVMSEMNRLRDQIAAGMDFLELAKTYSELPVSEAYFKHGELTKAKENAVFSAKKGDIVGPVIDYDGFHLFKVLDERRGSAPFVRASHILLSVPSDGDTARVIAEARELIRSLRSGLDFAQLARERSQDVVSGRNGGDLGWGGRGTWVKPFEQAAFNGRVGDVVGPVRTQFGWHIIKITGRDQRELKLASISMKVKASPQTIDRAYELATDFTYLAGDEGFERTAELSHYEVRTTPEFTEGSIIPGIGQNNAAMRFAFSEDLNAVSEPIKVRDGVAVFKISKVVEEGVRPFEEVRSLIQASVRRSKKLEIASERASEFRSSLSSSDDLAEKAQSYPGVVTGQTGPFHPQDIPRGVGRDPGFIGLALSLSAGEISEPFEGQRGYYVLKLVSETPFDSVRFASESPALRQEILQEKRNRISSTWITALRDQSDIEDYRHKFFR